MRQQFNSKSKCNACGSEDIKKRKNFSHGNRSKAKVSYYCNECKSSDIKIAQQRNNFKKRK